MNKLVVFTGLMIGIAIGWFLRGAIEPAPMVASPSTLLPDTSLEMDSGTVGLVSIENVSISADVIEQKESVSEKPNKQNFDKLMALLNAGQDAEAIEWYTSLERINGDIEGARRVINQQVNMRERRNDVRGAIQLLKLLLAHLPQAFDERIALASIYGRQQQFYEALTVLFDASSIASTSAELSQLDLLIQQTVRSAQVAIGEEDINANIKLYQFLVQHRAAHTPYYIEVAKWLVKASRLDAAIAQLVIVLHDPFVGAVAQQMLADIERLRLKLLETPVELVRKGSHFLVDASLNRDDVRLLIDTGASLSVLDSATAQLLGLHESDAVQRMQVNTANGITEALLYRIDSMALGVFAVSSIDIAVVEQLEVSGASGLLGMNFLEHFDFRIDQQHAQLFLKYRD